MPPLKRPIEVPFDREDVRRLIERELDLRMRTRLEAILRLMQGERQADVAQELQVSTASLREWTKKWDAGGYYALLSNRKGGWLTQISRESMRRDGFDLIREGGYFVMQPLATHCGVDSSGEPIEPIYLGDWDRPSKASLASLIN